MFAVIFFRLLILTLILFLIVKIIKYIANPKRKLELAHEQKQFYFWDDHDNVRKNFLITYKGVLFEGEKYLGTTDQAFEIVSIFIWAKDTDKLQGLKREDFLKIEADIKRHYPNARMEWKNPIRNFLNNQ
ncbi:sigma-w pathway protein ysdB [Schinkia sp. CFF1]